MKTRLPKPLPNRRSVVTPFVMVTVVLVALGSSIVARHERGVTAGPRSALAAPAPEGTVPQHDATAGQERNGGNDGPHAGSPRADSDAHGPETGSGAPLAAAVRLDPRTLDNIGLTTEVARTRRIERTLRFPGTVRMHPDGVASVSARIQGKVLAVPVAPGDTVERGSRLVTIQSLVPGTPPPTTELRAPIRGVVASRNAVVGEAVRPDKELFRLVDPRRIVAEARVPERIVDRIRLGQTARVHRLRDHGEWIGRVSFVGAEADPDTRTYAVWVELSGSGPSPPRPGQFLEIQVVQSSRTGLAVPRESVVEDGAARVVFVKRGPAFERRTVALGEEDALNAEILVGLEAGDTVAVTGSYELLLALSSVPVAGESAPHEH